MKEQQWGRGRGAVSDTRAKHYIRTQGIKIGHRGSAIRRESVTEGCDRGASRGVSEGSKGASWMLAVTEPRDETGRGGGGVDDVPEVRERPTEARSRIFVKPTIP